MGNLAFVSSKKNLYPHEVTSLLVRINAEFFDNLWTIDNSVAPECWQFYYKSPIPRIGRSEEMETYSHPYWEFWLQPSKRKLSSNHPRPGVEWVRWSWNMFQNECAHKWGGRLSDEGGEGTWAPKPFQSFEDYVTGRFRHIDNDAYVKHLRDEERAYLPQAFGALAT